MRPVQYMKTALNPACMKKFLLLIACHFALNASAQTPFTKVIEAPGSQVQGNGITALADSTYLLFGAIGDHDAFLSNVDSAGNVLWTRQYSDTTRLSLVSVKPLPGGDLAGLFSIQHQFSPDSGLMAARMDASGTILWARKVIYPGIAMQPCALLVTTDNRIVIAGDALPVAIRPTPICVAQFDFSGNQLDSRLYEHANKYYNQWINSLTELPDHEIVVSSSGMFYLGGFTSSLLFKIDASGHVPLAKSFSYPFQSFNDLFGFTPMNGKYYSVLITGPTNFLIEMDSDFVTSALYEGLWSLTRSGSPVIIPQVLAGTNNELLLFSSGYCMAGKLQRINLSTLSNTVQDVFMSMNGLATTPAGGYLLSGNGPLCVVRSIPGTSPHLGLICEDSTGFSPGCISQSDYSIIPTYFDSLNVSVNDSVAGLVTAYTFSSNAVSLTTSVGCVGVIGGIDGSDVESKIEAIPNPAHESVLITSGTQKISQVTLYDIQGRILKQITVGDTRISISLEGIVPGLLIYESRYEDGSTVYGKLIHE